MCYELPLKRVSSTTKSDGDKHAIHLISLGSAWSKMICNLCMLCHNYNSMRMPSLGSNGQFKGLCKLLSSSLPFCTTVHCCARVSSGNYCTQEAMSNQLIFKADPLKSMGFSYSDVWCHPVLLIGTSSSEWSLANWSPVLEDIEKTTFPAFLLSYDAFFKYLIEMWKSIRTWANFCLDLLVPELSKCHSWLCARTLTFARAETISRMDPGVLLFSRALDLI